MQTALKTDLCLAEFKNNIKSCGEGEAVTDCMPAVSKLF